MANKNTKDVKKKKKMTKYERNKMIMKICGYFMAAVMVIGSLLSIFGLLIYYK